METVAEEPKETEMTLKERFKTFTTELSSISTRHHDIQEKQREKWLEYHKLLDERQGLSIININGSETEAIKQLDQKIKTLKAEVDKFEKEITDLSPERVREIVISHPQSKLHVMALEIQTEGLKEIEVKLAEIGTANDEIEKAKQTYLELVKKAGQQYRELAEINHQVKKAEEMLPEKKNKHLPRIPNWNDYEIPEKDLLKTFGRRPLI